MQYIITDTNAPEVRSETDAKNRFSKKASKNNAAEKYSPKYFRVLSSTEAESCHSIRR